MLRTVMASIMRRPTGLTWAIGNSCLRDGLQHPHPLRQPTRAKSRSARRGSGFVQSPRFSQSRSRSTASSRTRAVKSDCPRYHGVYHLAWFEADLVDTDLVGVGGSLPLSTDALI